MTMPLLLLLLSLPIVLTVDPSATGAHAVSLVLAAQNVALWWPNTYGDQVRYELHATFTAASAQDRERGDERGKSSLSTSTSSSSISTSRLIGFRTVAFVNRMFSANGTDNGFTGKPRQFFRVNGVDLFVRGANFVTVDVLESRVTAQRYRHLLQSARDAHFSIFRVNGDANYMKDEFYDLCDEYGILIHFEFMLSDCDYSHVMQQEHSNQSAHFLANIRAEVTHQVRRASHHPAVAMWLSNNEIAIAATSTPACPVKCPASCKTCCVQHKGCCCDPNPGPAQSRLGPARLKTASAFQGDSFAKQGLAVAGTDTPPCYKGSKNTRSCGQILFLDTVLDAVLQEDKSRPIWPVSASNGWVSGADPETSHVNGEPLVARGGGFEDSSNPAFPNEAGRMEEHQYYFGADVCDCTQDWSALDGRGGPGNVVYPDASHASEYGWIGAPSFNSFKQFSSAADWNMNSSLMVHSQNRIVGERLLLTRLVYNFPNDSAAILRQYGAKPFGRVTFLSQLLQALCLRQESEHYRRGRDFSPGVAGRPNDPGGGPAEWRRRAAGTMGTMYWTLNSDYPSSSWGSIDVTGSWRLTHYAIAQAYSPLLLSLAAMSLPSNATPPAPSPPSPTCQRNFDMNKEGTTISTTKEATPAACCASCGGNAACKAFTWLSGSCYLSNSAGYHSADGRPLISGLCTGGACSPTTCAKCSGGLAAPSVRSLVLHVANDHHSQPDVPFDTSALKLELVRFADGKSVELDLSGQQIVQSGSGKVIYSRAVADVLRASGGLCASAAECLALATFRDYLAPAVANTEGGLALLGNFKSLGLKTANIKAVASCSVAEGCSVALTSDAVALYATLSSSLQGRFSTNGVLLRPNTPRKLAFLPFEGHAFGFQFSAANFSSTLSLQAVNLGEFRCSTSHAHMATDFNGVATADVSLTKLLASRFTKRAKVKTDDAVVIATAWQAVAPGTTAPNDPKCGVSGDPDGQVITWNDRGPHRRCIAIVTPPRPVARLPVLFYFHGSGGNAAGCDKLPLAAVAKQNGFALVCGEAVQDPETGGQWDMPNVITDRTGTPCRNDDSHDLGYITGALAQLSKVGRFDLSRIFFSGCSQGSGFSSYISTCTKQNPATAANLSAFATHSTGLKTKGDGIVWGCCSDIEECEECQYFPFAPWTVPHADTVGLKACIFDNVDDRLPRNATMPSGKGFFYSSSVEMAKVWRARGNRAETHFGQGGHCQIHSFYAIAKCLDDGTGRLCHEAGCTNRSVVTVKSDDGAARAATCKPDPMFQPKLLNFSWDTLPTFWQGTPQQLQTAGQISMATEFSMVAVTHHHGLVDEAIAACRRVKLAKPACSCILYWDVQLVVNDSAVGAAFNPKNGSRRAWLLRDDAGQLMLPAGKFLTPDYRLEGAGAWFLSGCSNATQSGFVDGCNLDGGNEFWYAYSAFLRNDANFAASAQASYIKAFRESLQQLQRSVPDKVLFLHCEQCVIPPSNDRVGSRSPCIPPDWCGDKGNGSAVGMNGQAIEDFFPSQEYVDIVRYMASCGKWFKAYVSPNDKHQRGRGMKSLAAGAYANCSDPIQRGTILAAWLVAAGEGHYFLCGEEGSAMPLPEFKLPLGEPTGPAMPLKVGRAVGLTRAFRSGTKASWIPGANSTARGTGCVKWATGQVTGVCPNELATVRVRRERRGTGERS